MWRTALVSQEKQPLETTLVFLSAEAVMAHFHIFSHCFFVVLSHAILYQDLISRSVMAGSL